MPAPHSPPGATRQGNGTISQSTRQYLPAALDKTKFVKSRPPPAPLPAPLELPGGWVNPKCLTGDWLSLVKLG